LDVSVNLHRLAEVRLKGCHREKRSDEAISAATAHLPPTHRLPRLTSKKKGGASMKQPCVYIMANRRHGTLYVGVTSQLPARVWQHKTGALPGFTSKYRLYLLVWYERHEHMESAILREKQLKAGSRQRKLDLIESLNPQWQDLYGQILL
jgi:putative endonuclease